MQQCAHAVQTAQINAPPQLRKVELSRLCLRFSRASRAFCANARKARHDKEIGALMSTMSTCMCVSRIRCIERAAIDVRSLAFAHNCAVAQRTQSQRAAFDAFASEHTSTPSLGSLNRQLALNCPRFTPLKTGSVALTDSFFGDQGGLRPCFLYFFCRREEYRVSFFWRKAVKKQGLTKKSGKQNGYRWRKRVRFFWRKGGCATKNMLRRRRSSD